MVNGVDFGRAHTHDVRLGPDSDQSVDVLADGYKHFACHMSALLRSRCLILNVNTGGTLLNKQLCELHNGRKPTVSSVCIGDDRTEVVDIRSVRAIRFWCGESLFSLLPVVEQLGHEKVLHLVGDGGLIE